jgi:hypothetical protein
MEYREIGWGAVYSIYVSQNRGQRGSLVNRVIEN